MDPITRICSLALLSACLAVPSIAHTKKVDPVERYAAARLAEIDSRDAEALKTYRKLYRASPDSEVLSQRMFDVAVKTGDMEAALQAVRALELSGDVPPDAPLLLFADAFQRKNWPMALLAADELSLRSNLAFMAPILRSWVNVAQGKPHAFEVADNQADPLLAYYSNDQRVYMDLAAGNYAAAKQGLRGLASVGGEYVRDAMLRSVPIMRGEGDDSFADALLSTAMAADRIVAASSQRPAREKQKLSPVEGLSALHTRIAAALLDQKINEPALLAARLAYWYAPDSDPAKIALAKALAAQGSDAAALSLFASIPPTSPYWLQAIGERTARSTPSAALMLARDAMARSPKSPGLILLTAQAQEASGDIAGAMASYRRLVDAADEAGIAPRQRASYRLLLARVLDVGGSWGAARAELDAALVLDPDNPQILNYLGYSLLERNEELPSATAMVRRAFEALPESPAITDSMGWAHFLAGDYDKAVPLLERAAKVAGYDPAINEHLGDAYWQAGRRVDARYAWRVASQAAEGEAVARIAAKMDRGINESLSTN